MSLSEKLVNSLHYPEVIGEGMRVFNQSETSAFLGLGSNILYRMSTFVLISIFRFFKQFPLTFVSNLVLQ